MCFYSVLNETLPVIDCMYASGHMHAHTHTHTEMRTVCPSHGHELSEMTYNHVLMVPVEMTVAASASVDHERS